MGLTKGWAWDIQLQGTVTPPSGIQFLDFDAQEASSALVASVLAKGIIPCGYISAGSWENWRPDANKFPVSVKGNQFGDWPGENYLDIRQLQIIMPILWMRILDAKSKGFVAIDWDNLDTYSHPSSGFPITEQDQLKFNYLLASFTHQNGMAVTLKNCSELVTKLEPYFDAAIVEEAYHYREADKYLPFTNKGKAVFMIEYSEIAPYCADAKAKGFSLIQKQLDLKTWRKVCP